MKGHVIVSFFIPHLGCTSNCVFCNQKTITGHRSGPTPEEVMGTIQERVPSMPADIPREVAFYGGSFTALPWDHQRSYLQAVQLFIQKGQIDSIRISTRPDALDGPGIDRLAAFGVKTIELGVQSLDREVLQASGRDYDPSLVGEVSSLIRQKGLTLGHQLMIGLPGSDLAKEMDTVREVVRLRPDLVRIYPTLVLKKTMLARTYTEGRYRPLSLPEAVEIAVLMLTQLEKAGIKVIRMGLQPTPELQTPGEVLAGPFHPSFGELVQSEVFKWQSIQVIQEFMNKEVTNRLRLFANRRDLSKMIGQNQRNLKALTARFKLVQLEVAGMEGSEQAWVGVGPWNREVPQMVLSRQSFLKT